MKSKMYIMSALSLFAFTQVNAQGMGEDNREKFEFGIKAGANASNVWDSQGEEFQADTKLGIAAGVYFSIPLSKFIGLQPEILISQKGFQGSGRLLFNDYSFTRTTSYLDVPLQIQIKPSSFLSIVGGPTFSYLINQKDVYTFGSNSTEQEQEFKNDNIRKNILGATVGLDVYISSLVVSARAGWDFQTNNGNGTSSTPRYKNQWLQLTLGFKI